MVKFIFYVGMFITLTMLNCWCFMSMANKLDREYSSVTSLFIDSSVLALGITMMYYGVLG